MNQPSRIAIDVPLGTPLWEIYDEVIRQALEACGYNLALAARRLDVSRETVQSAKKRLDEKVRQDKADMEG